MGKRILVLATTFPRWKNDTEPAFVADLSEELAKNGHKVVVLAPHHAKARKSESFGKVKVHRFSYFFPVFLQKLCYEGGILENMKKSVLARIQVPFLVLAELISALRIVKKEKIDIIHAHWIIPQGFVAASVKALTGKKYMVTAHAGDIFPIKRGLFRAVARFALKNADTVTANSTYTAKALKKVYSRSVDIIPMGVGAFTSSKKQRNTILFVGRLAEKKGVTYLLQAMPAILRKIPDAHLTIVGDGPQRKKLLDMARQLQLHNAVTFAGSVSKKNLAHYYSRAAVFVGPSIVTKSGDTEGLGVVFLESLAAGTPVIGSNVGGIPDIIKHGKTGLLVKQKDPQDIAQNIVKVLSNAALRKKLATQGKRFVTTEFSWKLIGKKFSKLF